MKTVHYSKLKPLFAKNIKNRVCVQCQCVISVFNVSVCSIKDYISVADPGFPRPGGGGGANLLFWLFFPDKCLKKLGWGGGGRPLIPQWILLLCI